MQRSTIHKTMSFHTFAVPQISPISSLEVRQNSTLPYVDPKLHLQPTILNYALRTKCSAELTLILQATSGQLIWAASFPKLPNTHSATRKWSHPGVSSQHR